MLAPFLLRLACFKENKYMQLHQITSKTKQRRGQRVGRGGKRGTTAGRGTKGQKARAGHKIRPAMRDIIKKMPKLRGYKFRSFQSKPAIVNLGWLDKEFQAGDTISPETLLLKGLIKRYKGRMPPVKILGAGTTKKKFVQRRLTNLRRP